MVLNEDDWKNFQKSEELHQFTNDPEDNPYQSKYEARKILQSLSDKFGSENDLDLTSKAALLCILYKLAINYVDTEERPEGEKIVARIFQLFEGDEQKSQVVAIYVASKNYLGFIYCDRSDFESSLKELNAADKAYHSYKGDATYSQLRAPWELTSGLQVCCGVAQSSTFLEDKNCEKCCWVKFEQLHTFTLFYLAQLYKNLNEFAKSASYCEQTLERQLEYQDYDPVEWALNAATLSQYYICKAGGENFPQARHCLAAASAIMDRALENLQKPQGGSTEDSALSLYEKQLEKIEHCKADIFRCAAKYGLALLEISKEKLLSRDKPDFELDAEQTTEESEESQMSHHNIFVMDDMSKFEHEITAAIVTDFVEAREVFLRVQHWLNKAKDFYKLNDYATDYVEIIKDLSQNFKVLAFFEFDTDRKCKMHKRRLDMLDSILKELSPQHYIYLCRQLIFELAETSNEMLDLKIEIADDREGGNPNSHQIAKINMLAQHGIRYFQMFLDSFRNAQDEMPEKFEQNAVRPVALAHFYIGRLYGKILTGDPQIKVVNLQHSLDHYQWIVRYCETVDPEAVKLVKSEYEVCHEMVGLLPMKIERIRTVAT